MGEDCQDLNLAVEINSSDHTLAQHPKFTEPWSFQKSV